MQKLKKCSKYEKNIKKYLHFLKSSDIIFIVSQIRHTNLIKDARLAQLVEHLTLNQGVQGSNPWSRTQESLFLTAANVGGGGFFLRSGKKSMCFKRQLKNILHAKVLRNSCRMVWIVWLNKYALCNDRTERIWYNILKCWL